MRIGFDLARRMSADGPNLGLHRIVESGTKEDIFDHPSARELARAIEGNDDADMSAGMEDYDYAAIDELIATNSMEHVDAISTHELKDIVLVGATGFLGIHVLKAYLDNSDSRVFCLIRRGSFESGEKHLQTMLS